MLNNFSQLHSYNMLFVEDFQRKIFLVNETMEKKKLKDMYLSRRLKRQQKTIIVTLFNTI